MQKLVGLKILAKKQLELIEEFEQGKDIIRF